MQGAFFLILTWLDADSEEMDEIIYEANKIMIHLKDQTITDEYHRVEPKEDLIRIQKALILHRDIFCTLDECGNIWQNYSWDLSASWLYIPNNLEAIIKHIESADNFKSYEAWLES